MTKLCGRAGPRRVSQSAAALGRRLELGRTARLQADVRARWLRIPQGVPSWYRYTDFTKKVTSALHRAGVPLMVGTDAMGFPLLTPGSSLHRELQLLVQSGLTPYEAVRAATVVPASFWAERGSLAPLPSGSERISCWSTTTLSRTSVICGPRSASWRAGSGSVAVSWTRCSMLFALRSAPPLDPDGCRECRAADVEPRAFHRPEARVGSGPRAELPVLARRGVRHSEPGRRPDPSSLRALQPRLPRVLRGPSSSSTSPRVPLPGRAEFSGS